MDITKYFPALDHAILLETLEQTIADERMLALCAKVIASGRGVLEEEYEMVYFPSDDLFARNRSRRLPIGNMTSQFWTNVYLNKFDHFVKRELKCRGYVRYVDDMLLFSDHKASLHAWREEAIAYLA